MSISSELNNLVDEKVKEKKEKKEVTIEAAWKSKSQPKFYYCVERDTSIGLGENAFGEMALKINLSALSKEQREELSRVGSHGYLQNFDGDFFETEFGIYTSPEEIDVAAILDARIAYRRRLEEEKEREIAKASALLDEVEKNPGEFVQLTTDGISYDERVKEACETLNWERGDWPEKLKSRAIEIRNSLREAEKQAETQQVVEWFYERGINDIDSTFIPRYTAGKLPEYELFERARDLICKHFKLVQYRPLRRLDLEHENKCPNQYSEDWWSVEVSELTSYSAEEWRQKEWIEKIIGSPVRIMSHSLTCNSCDESTFKNSYRHTFFLGEHKINVDFAE